MKIVIDIPIEAFNYIKDNKKLGWIGDYELAEAIANGTPLPKNHGRLIDENDLWFEDIDDISCVTQRNVENVPTIIEAENEEEK